MNELLVESRPMWLPMAIAFIVTVFLLLESWGRRRDRRSHSTRHRSS